MLRLPVGSNSYVPWLSEPNGAMRALLRGIRALAVWRR
jgi:hypothetical protein